MLVNQYNNAKNDNKDAENDKCSDGPRTENISNRKSEGICTAATVMEIILMVMAHLV
jgi:hypothetical protein